MGALGMGRRRAYVDVDGEVVRVRMGWAFQADIPRAAIGDVHRREKYVWWAYGVHGGGGRWIVNGSGHDIVVVPIEPRAKGRVLGVRVRLRELWVSLEEPAAFEAALSSSSSSKR
jgi:hypothetical protein